MLGCGMCWHALLAGVAAAAAERLLTNQSHRGRLDRTLTNISVVSHTPVRVDLCCLPN